MVYKKLKVKARTGMFNCIELCLCIFLFLFIAVLYFNFEIPIGIIIVVRVDIANIVAHFKCL